MRVKDFVALGIDGAAELFPEFENGLCNNLNAITRAEDIGISEIGYGCISVITVLFGFFSPVCFYSHSSGNHCFIGKIGKNAAKSFFTRKFFAFHNLSSFRNQCRMLLFFFEFVSKGNIPHCVHFIACNLLR